MSRPTPNPVERKRGVPHRQQVCRQRHPEAHLHFRVQQATHHLSRRHPLDGRPQLPEHRRQLKLLPANLQGKHLRGLHSREPTAHPARRACRTRPQQRDAHAPHPPTHEPIHHPLPRRTRHRTPSDGTARNSQPRLPQHHHALGQRRPDAQERQTHIAHPLHPPCRLRHDHHREGSEPLCLLLLPPHATGRQHHPALQQQYRRRQQRGDVALHATDTRRKRHPLRCRTRH